MSMVKPPPPEDSDDEAWMLVAKFFLAMSLCLPISWVAGFFFAEWFNVVTCPVNLLDDSQLCNDSSLWRQDVFLVTAAWLMAFFIWITGLLLGYWRIKQPHSILIFYSAFSVVMPFGGIAMTISWLGLYSAIFWGIVCLAMTWFNYFKHR